MPRLPHHHAHYPQKGSISVCRCGDTLKTPEGPVSLPQTEVAPLRKPITWEGIRRALKPYTEAQATDATTAIVEYLLKHGIEVEPPF